MRKVFIILTMCLAFAINAKAQQTVTGMVAEVDGTGIPGVSVVEKGTANGTITNASGEYTITVSSDAILMFTFVGLETVEEPVNQRSQINVTMKETQIGLEEVVVTALGISKEKKALGYSVTEVKADDISTVKDHNALNSLAGKVAGVVITQGSGGPGAGSRVVIRGNNSITGNNQPLIVVDGVPIDDSGSNSGGSVYSSTISGGGITDINPDDIASISVLKGPNAAALYGSRAGNGVLLITTKRGTRGKGLGVTLNSNITFDTPMILPDYQNEYGQGSQGNVPGNITDLKNSTGSWGPRLDGSSKLYFTGEQRPYVAYPDNVNDFFRTAGKYINTLALDGGGENYSMRFSYTNNYTESMLPNSDLLSHNFNLRGIIDLTDKFSIDAKTTYFVQDVNNRASQGAEGVLAYVLDMPRSVDINDLKVYQKPEESLNSISYGAL
ncbi:MAG TPA: TonB-dependent receptor plug domain-containing protein, partial [Prolixibacteraceae bacterium]|nr:TonB-dependent receptor plug domain-containing protein [Prolixibacteraceae bacterium]